jgi:molecular chaperone GrpE
MTDDENPPREENERKPIEVIITDIELENLKKELVECKDKYLRVLAEAENARKRLQKERQELLHYAIQNVIVDFLNPIDHFENALNFSQQASEEIKHWALGFQMILNQFRDVLVNNGVVSIKSEGSAFDPHQHEAIEMIITADFPAGTIVAESLKGYKMGDRTIRPARVKVAKAPQPDNLDANKVEKK